MDKGKWVSTQQEKPKEGEKVETMIADEHGVRNQCKLKYHSGRWWTDSMYTYYTPTHWLKENK